MKAINGYANIFGPIGYAHHARKFFAALNELVPVCLVPKSAHLPDEVSQPPLSDMLMRLESIDLKSMAINIDYPEEMFRFTGSKKIAYTVFESNQISRSGINQLGQMDDVWVPTQWGRQILIENGLSESLVHVVPEGVDTTIFSDQVAAYDELSKNDDFKFLSVGKWEERKGIRELLQAFDLAFAPDDKVQLLLYYPGHVSALKGIDVKAEIDALNLKNRARIVVIETILPSEKDMARLYRSCQAYVSASKAEGWGLPLCEAMACGLPVIAPFYSGPTEYLNADNAIILPVNHLEEVYCPTFFPTKGAHGLWAKIEPSLLAEKMRWVFENKSAAQTLGQKARLDMQKKWSWANAAETALHHLAELE